MLKQATSAESMKRFEATAWIFRKHGAKYNVDYLLMVAKGYQESGLNESPVGAVGVMQLMPATGKDMNVGDITKEEPNIQAGIKYSELTLEKYYGKEPMDDLNKILFSFVACNCDPARVKQLRAEAAQKGLDPNNNRSLPQAPRVASVSWSAPCGDLRVSSSEAQIGGGCVQFKENQENEDVDYGRVCGGAAAGADDSVAGE